MRVHPIEQLARQIVLFQQMAELEHRGLVWHLIQAADFRKMPHRHRVVQSLFCPRVAQRVSPL